MKKLWKQRMEPFRIWGNLWFCGSVPSSCHVIDTGEGLILIDPGLPETFYLVVQSLWELGFEPKQVTMYSTSALGVVIGVPAGCEMTILDFTEPSFSRRVDSSAMKECPPLESCEPRT